MRKAGLEESDEEGAPFRSHFQLRHVQGRKSSLHYTSANLLFCVPSPIVLAYHQNPTTKSIRIFLCIIMSSLSDMETPPKCTADFCLIPLGTPTASVSEQIADVQRLLKKSGLKYSMHSAGTTVEGSWTEVMTVIGQAHSMLHSKGVVRIQSDIRIGSRTDKTQTMEDKVSAVNRLLAAE